MISNPQISEMALFDSSAAGTASEGGGDSPGAAAGQSESLWTMVDDRMRGRWRWAIALAIVLGSTLAVLGYRSTGPLFQSQGVVQIMPSAPMVLHEIPEATIGSYPSFVATHIQYIRSQPVLEAALDEPELAAFAWSKSGSALGILKAGLEVEWDRDSQFVFVNFESSDPKIAQAAVSSILRAYDTRFAKLPLDEKREQLNAIERKKLRDQNSFSDRRASIASKHGTSDLKEEERACRERVGLLEQEIVDHRRALERMEARAEDKSSAIAVNEPTLEDLERIDPELAMARQGRDQAKFAFEQAKAIYLPKHRTFQNYQARQESAQRHFDEQKQIALQKWKSLPLEQQITRGTSFDGKSADELRDELAGYEADAAIVKQRLKQILADMTEYQEIELELQSAASQLLSVRTRLESLENESKAVSGMIKIVQTGYLPDAPYKDARVKRSVMGLGLGALASFGAFFLLGTVDRRAFGAAQLRQTATSKLPACLGVLPDLGATFSDPESSDVASHCVHQIRNQIEAVRGQSQGYVLAVTSPFQGDGKTSIVMALGWSYAAAGYNTLLIDCDFVGRSLTRQLGLVGREGLKEALVARELNGSVSSLPLANLSAVPAGVDARFGPENMQRHDLANLLSQVRDRFDIILIDTGPMLGSLESTPVAAVSDGVVLSVRRGRSRTRLEDCINRLQIVGTRCLGVILNCAVRSDCNRYVSEASLAAAEEDRVVKSDEDEGALVPALPGDRNALIHAMQTRTRTRPD